MATKKRVNKQSSARLSTLAAQWMRKAQITEDFAMHDNVAVPTSVLKELCASVISQDERKGQTPLPRARGRARR